MAVNVDIEVLVYIIGSIISWLIISTIMRSKLIRRTLISLFGMMAGSLIFLNIIDGLSMELDSYSFTLTFLGAQFVLALIFTFLFKRGVSDPLKGVIDQTDRMADGDLSSKIEVGISGVGETGSLIHSINVLSTRFKTIIGNIKSSAFQLGQAAEELAAGSEEVAATTEEVTGTIQTIAEGAAEQVRRLDEVSTILNEMVTVTEDSIRQIGITSKITLDLAEQTNLVSLNAAIEASKASGESEGFQVVADHVRQLSEESKSAANSVNQITKRISARMRDSVDKIVSAVDKIASVAENTAASSQEAAAAAEEQSAALQEITQQAQQLSDLSDRTERNIGEFTVE